MANPFRLGRVDGNTRPAFVLKKEVNVNIGELKELINELPNETLVVLSRDEEGNGYAVASCHSTNHKFKNGEIGLITLTEEAKGQGYTDEDVMKGGKAAFVLWP